MRENTDQNNSEYGPFPRSGTLQVYQYIYYWWDMLINIHIMLQKFQNLNVH